MIEVAFGYRRRRRAEYGRRVIEGFNFSPGHRRLAVPTRTAAGAASTSKHDDPVTVFAHLTSPRLSFLDRGKAKVNLPQRSAVKLTDIVTAVTKAWTKQKRAEIRHARRAAAAQRTRWAERDKPMNQKDAAYAGDGRRLHDRERQRDAAAPTRARFIYAARPRMLASDRQAEARHKYFTPDAAARLHERQPGRDGDWNIVVGRPWPLHRAAHRPRIGFGTLAVQGLHRELPRA